jgi:hypothetical protein
MEFRVTNKNNESLSFTPNVGKCLKTTGVLGALSETPIFVVDSVYK